MSRTREVYRKGVWVELDLDAPLPPRVTPYVMGDTKEYRSIVTGEVIGSRSQHREHLRQHNCIEVGNEMPRTEKAALPPVRHDIERALQASPETHARARAISDAAAEAGPVERVLP